MRFSGSAWTWPSAQEIEIAKSHDIFRRRYNGSLDDFRIYNRRLTDAEIAQLYAGDGGVGAADLGTDIS